MRCSAFLAAFVAIRVWGSHLSYAPDTGVLARCEFPKCRGGAALPAALSAYGRQGLAP